MGRNFLDKPETDKHCENGNANGLRFALCSMQGWRVASEDSYTAVPSLESPFETWSFFGVFDGHGGSFVSKYCAKNLLEFIMDTKEFTELKEHSVSLSPETRRDCIKKGLVQGFLMFDDHLRKLPEIAEKGDRSGSTAVCALICPDMIYLLNCGDSRGLIVSNQGVVISTFDHKPNRPMERLRIERAGGTVIQSLRNGVPRLNNCFAMSRSLGDFSFKQISGLTPAQQLVSPVPEIFEWLHEEDEILILACDGVWDVMSNRDVCQFVWHHLTVEANLETISSKLVDHCLKKGSRDNISVILIIFPGTSGVVYEVAHPEKQIQALDKAIDETVQEVLEIDRFHQYGEMDTSKLIRLAAVKLVKSGINFPYGVAVMKAKVAGKLIIRMNDEGHPTEPRSCGAGWND